MYSQLLHNYIVLLFLLQRYLLAREPDCEEVVVDDVARWGTINQILVKQYIKGRLDAAGAGKVVTLDKLVTLRTGHTTFFGNGGTLFSVIVITEFP